MGSTFGCLCLRWQGTEHVSRDNWQQTQFAVIQRKVVLSAILMVLEISRARGAKRSVAVGKKPKGGNVQFSVEQSKFVIINRLLWLRL